VRIGLEAGPLSQSLYAGMQQAGLRVVRGPFAADQPALMDFPCSLWPFCYVALKKHHRAWAATSALNATCPPAPHSACGSYRGCVATNRCSGQG
jgi:hypothetical protein